MVTLMDSEVVEKDSERLGLKERANFQISISFVLKLSNLIYKPKSLDTLP